MTNLQEGRNPSNNHWIYIYIIHPVDVFGEALMEEEPR